MAEHSVKIFFNFRSPYCYLVSRSLFEQLESYKADIKWRSLGGWDGRSPPDRAKVKVPLTRQDVSRWCKRLSIPFNPPPITTDPTPAAKLAFVAEDNGCLPAYVKAVMWAEWAEGQDIGEAAVLRTVAEPLGISGAAVDAGLANEAYDQRLQANWDEAKSLGVIGVPTCVIGEEIFWGNDRLDFLLEHLDDLGLKR